MNVFIAEYLNKNSTFVPYPPQNSDSFDAISFCTGCSVPQPLQGGGSLWVQAENTYFYLEI